MLSNITEDTVAAISSHHHKRGKKIGLIWFDAHGDVNTPESSESGNIHGMPLGALCGVGDRRLIDLGVDGIVTDRIDLLADDGATT